MSEADQLKSLKEKLSALSNYVVELITDQKLAADNSNVNEIERLKVHEKKCDERIKALLVEKAALEAMLARQDEVFSGARTAQVVGLTQRVALNEPLRFDAHGNAVQESTKERASKWD